MSKVENIKQEVQGRWPLLAVMLLAIELFFGSGCTVPQTSESAKPNIIFILTDDQDFLVEFYTPPDAPPTNQSYYGLRTYDTLYVEYASGEHELYDLKVDLYQLSSLHKAAGSERMNVLSNRLSKLKTCAAKTCRD